MTWSFTALVKICQIPTKTARLMIIRLILPGMEPKNEKLSRLFVLVFTRGIEDSLSAIGGSLPAGIVVESLFASVVKKYATQMNRI